MEGEEEMEEGGDGEENKEYKEEVNVKEDAKEDEAQVIYLLLVNNLFTETSNEDKII